MASPPASADGMQRTAVLPSTPPIGLGESFAGGPHATVKPMVGIGAAKTPPPPLQTSTTSPTRKPYVPAPLPSNVSPTRTRRDSARDDVHRSADHAMAASAAAYQAALPDLFRRSGGLEGLRPHAPAPMAAGVGAKSQKETGFYEVFPRSGGGETRKPRLLTRLETLLQERLRVSEKLASPANRSGGDQYTGGNRGAANMRLDAHRHVLEAFIQSFTTYRPLLMKVKGEYDRALDAALRSEHENIHMRAELAALEQRAARKVEEARADAASAAAEQRAELHARLMEAQERAASLEARAVEAESRALRAETHIEELSVEVNDYRERCEEMKRTMLEESTWAEKAIAETVSGVTMGPVDSSVLTKASGGANGGAGDEEA